MQEHLNFISPISYYKKWKTHTASDKCILNLTFCASSCLSKLTNPKPLDFPLSSVITFTLKAGPEKKFNDSNIFHTTFIYFKFQKSCVAKNIKMGIKKNPKPPEVYSSYYPLSYHRH